MFLEQSLQLKDALKPKKMDEYYVAEMCGFIPEYRRYKMGFSDDILFKIFTMEKLEHNYAIAEAIVKKLPQKQRTFEIKDKVSQEISDRAKSASLDELVGFCEAAENIVKAKDAGSFYRSLAGVYYTIAEEVDKMSYASAVFRQAVLPLLSEHTILSKPVLERWLPKDSFRAVKEYLGSQVTIDTIAEFNSDKNEKDKRRNELHQELLVFAKEKFRKDWLDVYIDIYSNLRLKGGGLNVGGKGMYLLLGAKQMPSSSLGEFSIRIFEKFGEHNYYRESIRRGYRLLRRGDRWHEHDPRYESRISGNSEAQDNQIIGSLKNKFPEFIAFSGDYLSKNMHGSYVFFKVAEINIDKMKRLKRKGELNKAPEAILKEMFEEMEMLCGKPLNFTDFLNQ
jgi:hypothetical protein